MLSRCRCCGGAVGLALGERNDAACYAGIVAVENFGGGAVLLEHAMAKFLRGVVVKGGV